jgi:hypothetical protein
MFSANIIRNPEFFRNLLGSMEEGLGNREQGLGNREQGLGNREQGLGSMEQWPFFIAFY